MSDAFTLDIRSDEAKLQERIERLEARVAELEKIMSDLNGKIAWLRRHESPYVNSIADALEAKDKRIAELEIAVSEQAEDDGLWFIAETAPEAYLQNALRYLHALVEQDEKALAALKGDNDE